MEQDRATFIKGVVRGGLLTLLVGGVVALGSRPESVDCTNCDRCKGPRKGRCPLGLR